MNKEKSNLVGRCSYDGSLGRSDPKLAKCGQEKSPQTGDLSVWGDLTTLSPRKFS